MEAFARAADLDHPDACYQLATTSIDDADGIIVGPVVDRDLLVHAAELGNVDAQRTGRVLHASGEEGFRRTSRSRVSGTSVPRSRAIPSHNTTSAG